MAALSNAQQHFLATLRTLAPNGEAVSVDRVGRFQTAIALERRGHVTVSSPHNCGWLVQETAAEPAQATGDGNKAKLRRNLQACLLKHFASRTASRAISGHPLDAARWAANQSHCGEQFFTATQEERAQQALDAINAYAGTRYTAEDVHYAQAATESEQDREARRADGTDHLAVAFD